MPKVALPQGKQLIIAGGPCSVESEAQVMRIAAAVRDADGHYLRGGAWKPRTKGGDWEGHKRDGLKILQKAGEEFGLEIITEILGPEETHMSIKDTITVFLDHNVSVFQVGARNAQNQELLNALGEAAVPVLLKNGMNTTLVEWLGSATRVRQDTLMLCIRGKNNEIEVARNGQDMATVAHLVQRGEHTIIFDPSHITGKRELVYDVTMGAIAMGVDGIIVETHYDPKMSRTDSRQAIALEQFALLARGARLARAEYLAQSAVREAFNNAQIPNHVHIYFRVEDAAAVRAVVGEGIEFKPYKQEEFKGEARFMTAIMPDGELGKFRQVGWNIGKVIQHKSIDGRDTVEGIRLTTASGKRIRLNPYSKEALQFRGARESRHELVTIELARGFANQAVLDTFLTVDMGRVEGVSSERLVIYRPYVEK